MPAPAYCLRAATDPLHADHHGREHGFPPADDAGWLERLAWEIAQPGLSWRVVLAKRAGMRRAFEGFLLDRVAGYGAAETARLLADAGIVRHPGKIAAIIHNAGVLRHWRDEAGSVAGWLLRQAPRADADRLLLLRRQLRFVGPMVAQELAWGTGLVEGAHLPDCPIRPLTLAARPIWLQLAERAGHCAGAAGD